MLLVILFLQRFCSQPSSVPSLQTPPLPPSSAPQQPGESAKGHFGSQGRQAAHKAAEELRAFCREALHECITQEKPGSLQSYVLLYSLMHGVLGAEGGPGMPPLGWVCVL